MLSPSDKKLDLNQQSNMPGKFQQIGANALLKLRHMILNHVVAGPGIQIERVGEKTVVSIKGFGRGGGGTGFGGSGATQVIWYRATTKAGLPSGVTETALGRVTAGADQGMVCVRNAANDGWQSINFWDS